jgi:hypothetical protein
MKVRKSIVAAAAAAVVGTTGALALPAVASAHPSSTTIKFIATTTASKSSKSAFAETGTTTQGKKLLGWYTLSCQFTSNKAAKCGGAGSSLKGMIYFSFPLSVTSKTFKGKVTGGTGAYRGATGKISGKSISSKKEAVTIVIK